VYVSIIFQKGAVEVCNETILDLWLFLTALLDVTGVALEALSFIKLVAVYGGL
jgi:hypothetical protein